MVDAVSNIVLQYPFSSLRMTGRPRRCRYFVGPLQFVVCYGTVVASTLLGGQCMKAVYSLSNPNGSTKLYEFMIIFGCLMLVLVQIPSFHSLGHIDLISMLLCLAYSVCATAAYIYIGTSKGSHKDYSLKGSIISGDFGILNANGIIPEIQVYLQPTNEVLETAFSDIATNEFSA
ncbi:hypothetical protein ACLB2K_012545 [Fragaria x ananassa]